MTQQDYLWKVDRAKRLSFEYYVLNRPSVSDEVFDGLVAQIEQAEQEHPEWTVADSPTQQVGSDLNGNGRRTIRHRTPMLSCQKAQTDNKSTNREKLEKWLKATEKAVGHKNFNYCLEWKFDGISCSLVYLNGDLISAATRGDHFKGQDITEHVMQMISVPHVLKRGTTYHDRVEVRGEVVCFKSTLPVLSDQDGKMYKDCRSAAAGLTNQAIVDPQCACLKFIPWELDAPLFSCNNSHSESLKLADFHNFTYGLNAQVVPAADHNQLFDMIEKMEACRDNQPFPVDGIVIKVDDKQLSASLGATEHHPKGSIAYKFAAAKTVSRVTRIEVTVGKTGRRTPVVHFEPVMILGREVKKASLGSERMLEEMGVKRGDMVEVGLANDVRPTIYRVIESNTDCTDMADPLEGIDFEGEESETKDYFSHTDNTDSTDDADAEEETTDDVEVAPAAPEVTAADLEAAVKACEERRSVIEQEAREKAVTGLELSQTGNKVTTDVTDGTDNETNTNLTNETNKSSKALKIGAAIVGVLVIAVCGITALAASVFLAPVLVGAFKG